MLLYRRLRVVPKDCRKNRIPEPFITLLGGKFITSPIPLSFWDKVTISDSDCWEGHNPKDNGYTRIFLKRVGFYAHRVTYALFVGPLIRGLEIDHVCHNRRCINPNHLEQVTRLINARRGGATGLKETTCGNGHPWDDNNTRWRVVKSKRGSTRLRRWCKECNTESNNRKKMRSPQERLKSNALVYFPGNYIRLTEKGAKEIIRRLGRGESPASIAAFIGVTWQTVYDVKAGRTWAHLDRSALLVK